MSSGSGRYWRKARALKASTSQDAMGMRTDNWVNGEHFRCELRNNSTVEMSYADGVIVRRTFEILMRWQTLVALAISEVDRITIDGMTLRIQSITNVAQGFMEASIIAEEVS
jgi:head-tail adaptor